MGFRETQGSGDQPLEESLRLLQGRREALGQRERDHAGSPPNPTGGLIPARLPAQGLGHLRRPSDRGSSSSQVSRAKEVCRSSRERWRYKVDFISRRTFQRYDDLLASARRPTEFARRERDASIAPPGTKPRWFSHRERASKRAQDLPSRHISRLVDP